MRAAAAHAIAECAHEGQLDPGSQPLIEHVRRVALASPRQARTVAWLHEVFEFSDISEQELLAGGLSDEELRALRLLSRPPGNRSRTSYLGHIARIASSAGPAGVIARKVKRVDLEDRVEHRARRPDGWSPPYERGLAILDASSGSSRPPELRSAAPAHDQALTKPRTIR
jgi:hypothetical protein